MIKNEDSVMVINNNGIIRRADRSIIQCRPACEINRSRAREFSQSRAREQTLLTSSAC